MRDLIQDIRYAARTLRRNPGFTAVSVAAMALGIGANSAVFTIVNGVLLRPLPFPEPGRLFLVAFASQHGAFAADLSLADAHYLEFKSQDRMFEQIATFVGASGNLTGGGDPVHIPMANITPNFLSVLRVNPATGRSFLAGEDQPGRDHVVLLSDKLWRSRYGGDSRMIGKTITLDGVRHTVVGIMPAGFAFPYDAELWTPLAVTLGHNSFSRPVVGRLKPGVSPQQARAELQTIMDRLPLDLRDRRSDRLALVVPLKELLTGNIEKSLWVFAGAVGFVLLIGCSNVANLLLARAAGRQQEMSVRCALGAGRWRLVRQLLTESTLVSLAGGAAGILIALWGVPALVAMAPAGKIPRVDQIRIDIWVLAFTLAVSVATGLLFGLAPALHATRRELRESLSLGGRTLAGGNEGLRGTLAVAEIALALVLLTGAGLMLKSFLRLRAVNPGFRAENVLTMTVELPESVYQTAPQIQAFDQRMLAKLSSLPGVAAAGAVNWSPLGSAMQIRGDFQIEGRGGSHILVDKLCASPGYLRAMGIRLLRGRDFTDRDNGNAARVVMISQSVARTLWPGENPIGKRIAEEDEPKAGDWRTIVGVVDDVRQLSLAEGADSALYYPYLQMKETFWLNRVTFAVRTASNPTPLAASMRAVLREVDRNQPVMAMATMQETISAATAEPRFQTRLLGVFSILALVLAVVGIYGVLAYSVTQRTHEIGIRMALGAERRDVLRMVLGRTLVLAAAGVALGTAGALAVTRVLAKFLYEVKPADPATFTLVPLLLVIVALAAGYIPARRAAQVDPMVALRYE